jgi:tetratricopeptide (TPR) repeat protein
MKKLVLTAILASSLFIGFSQNPNKIFKVGEEFYEKKDYKAAIEEFTQVINLKADHDEAYYYRGLSHLALNDLDKAVDDLKKATAYKDKEGAYHLSLGKVYFLKGDYQNALTSFTNAIDNDKKNLEAYEYKTRTLLHLNRFQAAVDNANEAVLIEKTAKNYLLLGASLDSIKNYKDAAYNYGRAKFYDSKMVDAYSGLAYSNSMLKEFDKALEAANKAVELDAKNIPALLVRSNVYAASGKKQEAVTDISNVITLKPENYEYYLMRGKLYQELAQYQNAVADYSKAIYLNKEDSYLYYMRGQAYELLADFKNAKKDYSTLKKMSPNDIKAQRLYEDAKVRLYNLNREENKPEIEMIEPVSPKEGVLQIARNKDYMFFKGQIIDESNISSIEINGREAEFNKDTINPLFELEVKIKDLDKVTISATDVYFNKETWNYEIAETEIDPPVVKLIAPYASDDGMIYLDSDDPSLYIEGIMQDKSLIKSILIDGATASFTLDETNPKFSATINILNKDNFTITSEDQFGNKAEKKFTINRENVALLADNPMGKTWVIFIENSDYKSFASLDGPTKDVTMMKSAFAKYKIHNIIHKKNMTKNELEKFFAIELRDLVRSNKVNSLLVWYAGHGKFINESGYWIPTDAKRDEEFTYYNINNLKASMQAYSKYITHTLVITDACESGPTFYQAMRSTPEDKSCNDWQATKFKSSQVFSSAGYELAVDNSQFTKTFANTLSGNPNSCIPIETVVKKVSSAVVSSGSAQKPKFGKIAGLEDENGTFFFIKK